MQGGRSNTGRVSVSLSGRQATRLVWADSHSRSCIGRSPQHRLCRVPEPVKSLASTPPDWLKPAKSPAHRLSQCSNRSHDHRERCSASEKNERSANSQRNTRDYFERTSDSD